MIYELRIYHCVPGQLGPFKSFRYYHAKVVGKTWHKASWLLTVGMATQTKISTTYSPGTP